MSVAAVDLGLRTWALVDLRRRPAENVNGPKAAWAAGLSVVSSAGLLAAGWVWSPCLALLTPVSSGGFR